MTLTSSRTYQVDAIKLARDFDIRANLMRPALELADRVRRRAAAGQAPGLEPWQERVLDEHKELCERALKLAEFLALQHRTARPAPAVDFSSLDMLHRQLSLQEQLLEILGLRIGTWAPTAVAEPPTAGDGVMSPLVHIGVDLREFIRANLADKAACDSGFGIGTADLWFFHRGTEYRVTIRARSDQLPRSALADLSSDRREQILAAAARITDATEAERIPEQTKGIDEP